MFSRYRSMSMLKKISFALAGGICAAAVIYFFIVGIGAFHDTPNENITISSDIIPTLNVSSSPILQIRTSAFQNLSMPMSPVLWSQLIDGYVVGQDVQSGMFGNVRYESAGTTDNFKETEKETPHTFGVIIGANTIEFPEMPTSLSSSVYYTHASGILPLTGVINWENISGRKYEDWEKSFIDNGFTRSDEVIVENNTDNVVKAISFLSSQGYTGEILYRENIQTKDKNKPVVKEVNHISLFITMDAENIVKDYLDEINKNAVKSVSALNSVKSSLEWRHPYVIADYRYIDSSRVYGIDFATLNDRTFLDTNVPVYSTTYESWGGIPIGWSWLMYKRDWDQVKEQVIYDIVGKKGVSDSDLIDGVRSDGDIFIKTELVGTGAGNGQMLKVSAVDKQVDNMISTIFDHFNIVDVQGLRNRQSGDLRGQKNKLEAEKNKSRLPNTKSKEIAAPEKQDIK